ncbi:MAG TPA: forespore capture DNA-binding protein RefZ [Candidatus Angelobacter sp.]|nr:forespore capture DNA-binding protein RefZ [Candidatus Angelobacter sp.]
MVKNNKSRQAVLDAASRLFHMYGYDGTSVRAIASEAGVNVALISYYFGGKKALLEQLMEHFLNGYIGEVERIINEKRIEQPPFEALLNLAEHLIKFQVEQSSLARFVYREISLDSILTREIMTTYLMKEKYLLESFFKEMIFRNQKDPYSLDFFIMQFREMIMLPFAQPQYIRKVYGMQPTQPAFISLYLKHLGHWAKGFIDYMPLKKEALAL